MWVRISFFKLQFFCFFVCVSGLCSECAGRGLHIGPDQHPEDGKTVLPGLRGYYHVHILEKPRREVVIPQCGI